MINIMNKVVKIIKILINKIISTIMIITNKKIDRKYKKIKLFWIIILFNIITNYHFLYNPIIVKIVKNNVQINLNLD